MILWNCEVVSQQYDTRVYVYASSSEYRLCVPPAIGFPFALSFESSVPAAFRDSLVIVDA